MICGALFSACHSVRAAEVGKDPTKVELSTAFENATVDLTVSQVVFENCPDLYFAEVATITKIKKEKDQPLNPGVSICDEDAAIPIRGEVDKSLTYSNYTDPARSHFKFRNWNSDRYWC